MRRWYAQFFNSLLPFPKCAIKHRSGDTVLVRYDQKYAKQAYRVGCLLESQMDSDQLVRNVVVGKRSRDSMQKSLPYQSAKLYRVKWPLQHQSHLSLWHKGTKKKDVWDPHPNKAP